MEITGDQIMIICANMLKAEGRLKNDLLVSTIMSNMGLSVACKKYGFKNHAAKVGDRYVLEDMQRLGGVIGGEESGHVIFLDHHTTGDGILTAMQLLAAMLKAGKPLSELAKLMDVFPQKLINVDVKSKPDIQTGARDRRGDQAGGAELKDEGRVLVRYSGTQNMCRVMVEGPDSRDHRKIRQTTGRRGQSRDRVGDENVFQDLRHPGLRPDEPGRGGDRRGGHQGEAGGQARVRPRARHGQLAHRSVQASGRGFQRGPDRRTPGRAASTWTNTSDYRGRTPSSAPFILSRTATS